MPKASALPSRIMLDDLTREGPWYYLHIRGTGGSISDGLVKIVAIENDPNTSHLPMALRTQRQTEGGRSGSFNIRVGEPKKIPFLLVKNLYDSMPETVDVAYETDGHFCHITDQNERIFHLLACGGDAKLR